MMLSRTRARATAGLAAVAISALAGASLPAIASASSGSATATPPDIKVCGTFDGPHWAYKGVGGTQYVVYTRRGGACAMAMKWAPKLVSKRPQTATYTITGGPSGWICANTVVHFGNCIEAPGGHPNGTSQSFAWAGSVKK